MASLDKAVRIKLKLQLKQIEDYLKLLKDSQRTDIEELSKEGNSIEDIAKLYNIKPYKVYKMLWDPIRDDRAGIHFNIPSKADDSFKY